MQGSGWRTFRFQGSGWRTWRTFRFKGSGWRTFRFKGSGFRVADFQVSGFRVADFRFQGCAHRGEYASPADGGGYCYYTTVSTSVAGPPGWHLCSVRNKPYTLDPEIAKTIKPENPNPRVCKPSRWAKGAAILSNVNKCAGSPGWLLCAVYGAGQAPGRRQGRHMLRVCG